MNYIYEEKLIEKRETTLSTWQLRFQEGDCHLFDIWLSH